MTSISYLQSSYLSLSVPPLDLLSPFSFFLNFLNETRQATRSVLVWMHHAHSKQTDRGHSNSHSNSSTLYTLSSSLELIAASKCCELTAWVPLGRSWKWIVVLQRTFKPRVSKACCHLHGWGYCRHCLQPSSLGPSCQRRVKSEMENTLRRTGVIQHVVVGLILKLSSQHGI